VRPAHKTPAQHQQRQKKRAGQEIEQIGIIQQEVVDLLGAVINKVRR